MVWQSVLPERKPTEGKPKTAIRDCVAAIAAEANGVAKELTVHVEEWKEEEAVGVSEEAKARMSYDGEGGMHHIQAGGIVGPTLVLIGHNGAKIVKAIKRLRAIGEATTN